MCRSYAGGVFKGDPYYEVSDQTPMRGPSGSLRVRDLEGAETVNRVS